MKETRLYILCAQIAKGWFIQKIGGNMNIAKMTKRQLNRYIRANSVCFVCDKPIKKDDNWQVNFLMGELYLIKHEECGVKEYDDVLAEEDDRHFLEECSDIPEEYDFRRFE